MAVYALAVIDAVRQRLDDLGGDRGAAPVGYYAAWQADDSPCLWSNQELVRYINQTLRDLGQRQPILSDNRDRYKIPLRNAVRQYAIPAKIVRIESVVRASDGLPLVKASVTEMQGVAKWNRRQREFLNADWRGADAPGYPTHYLLDERQGYLTVYPTPADGYLDSLYLVVRRSFLSEVDWSDLADLATIGPPAPAVITITVTGRTTGSLTVMVGGDAVATGVIASGAITVTDPIDIDAGVALIPTGDFDGAAVLELDAPPVGGVAIADVPDHAFDALVAGVCARAYRKRDSDTSAPQLAAECEAEFTRYAGPPRTFLHQEADARWADLPDAITPRTFFAR